MHACLILEGKASLHLPPSESFVGNEDAFFR
jgi:hypothetical protein